MLSANNILSPANGRCPNHHAHPGHGARDLLPDRVTMKAPTVKVACSDPSPKAIMAFDAGQLSLRATIRIRLDGSSTPPDGYEAKEGWEPGQPFILETTLGRALFNGAMPAGYPFANYEVDKKRLGALVNDLAETQSKVQVAATLDALKELGFYWATAVA